MALFASNFSIDQGGGKRRLCIAKMCLIEINASILTIRILFDMTCQGYTKTIAQTKTITVAKPKLITSEGEVVKIPRLIRRLI